MAEPAFVRAMQKFAEERGFRFRRDMIAPVERGQTMIQLDRADVEIAGANVFDNTEFSFAIYRGQSGASVSNEMLDQMLDDLIAAVESVPGVSVTSVERRSAQGASEAGG